MGHLINIAVVGLGIGRLHVDGAANCEGGRLYAVCDIREDRIERITSKYPDVLVYRDYDEMLKDKAIDLITIAVPSGMHADFAIKALRAGKHVLIEKPMDIQVDRILEIEKVRLETGLKVGGVFQNRRLPVMQPLKKAVEEGRLGKIFTGAFRIIWYRSDEYFKNDGHWRGTWTLDGGGSLMNQGVHTVDIMQWLLGEVSSVKAETAILNHNDIETEDFVFATVKFKNGAIVHLTSTTCAYPGISTDIQLIGTNGTIFIDSDVLKVWKIKGESQQAEEEESRKMLETYSSSNLAAFADPSLIQGHQGMVQDMVDAIRFDRDPMVGPMEATKAVRIVTAVYESAKSGKEIFFD